MEIGAVAAPDITCIDRVTTTPSLARFVVLHDRCYVFVNHTCLLIGRDALLLEVGADFGDPARRRNQPIAP